MAKVGHDLDHTVMQFAFFVSVMLAEQWLMWSYTLNGTGCLAQTYRGTAVKKACWVLLSNQIFLNLNKCNGCGLMVLIQ